MRDHTVKAFDIALQDLGRKIGEMGGIVETQVETAMAALGRHDVDLAHKVIAADARLDALHREIEEEAILTIARRQPMAVDLREIIAAFRIASDLERAGDYAKNIAKRVVETEPEVGRTALRGLHHMAELVSIALRNVLDAYARRDVEQALTVWREDEQIDAVHNSLFRELLTYMMEDARNISSCIHFLFCAKNIERIGDHATNIAETIYFMVKGTPLTAERPKQ